MFLKGTIFVVLFLHTSDAVVFQGSCSDVTLLCEQLCITISPETYECGCWNDHVLLTDGITCKLNLTFSDVHTYNAAYVDSEEFSTALSFNGNSYAEFPLLESAYLETNISIEFRISQKRDGLLLFAGQFKGDDFISLALIGPNVVVRHDCGEGAIEDLYRGPFAENVWHNLTVWRKYCDRTEMRADKKTRLLDVTDQFKNYKGIVMDEGIFIGGAPKNIEYLDNRAGTARGFNGCIRKVVVNNEVLLDDSADINKAVNSILLDHCGSSNNLADLEQFEEFNIATGLEENEQHVLSDKLADIQRKASTASATTRPETTTHESQMSHVHFSDASDVETTVGVPLLVAEFDGNSYLNLSASMDVLDYVELNIHVKPTSQSGLIFLWQDDQKYIAVYLDRGFVIVQTTMGADTTILRSANVISLHQWHRIESWRSGKGILLKVGHQLWVESELMSMGSPSSSAGSVTIGGAPSTSKLSHLPAYQGCIKHVRLNSRALRLTSARGVRECGSDPCASAGCPNTCTSNHQQFVCLCDWPTFGLTCDRVSTSVISAMNFQEHSYLELTSDLHMNQVTGDSLRLNVEFKVSNSTEDNVVQHAKTLVFAGASESRGDFIRLSINPDQFVQFSMNLGSGTVQLSHPTRIFPERWTTVSVIREKRHVTLSINGESPISTVASEGSEQLNVYSSIYFGGTPTGNIKGEGFDGCISSIDIGSTTINHPSQAHSAINIEECRV